jgi:rfaE bifunctional protein kinase chain/domain
MSIGAAAVDRLRGHRVLVIGDLMIDEYLRGEVHRVSPEAPVPVLDLRATEHRLGGAANTAHNLARLGATVTVAGVVGDDDGARILAEALERAGIAARLWRDPTRPTTRKTRVVAGGHQIVRIDAERRTAIDGAALTGLLGLTDAAIAETDAVVLSDYAKGVITRAVAERAIAACRGRAVPVVVDPKQRDVAIYARRDRDHAQPPRARGTPYGHRRATTSRRSTPPPSTLATRSSTAPPSWSPAAPTA